MHKVPFTNTKDHPVYAADGTRVMAGQTRMINAPSEHIVIEVTPEPDPLLGLLDNNIAEIVPHLANMDAAQLTALLSAEQDGKTRKTLIEAIELRIMETEDAAKLAAEAGGEGDGDSE